MSVCTNAKSDVMRRFVYKLCGFYLSCVAIHQHSSRENVRIDGINPLKTKRVCFIYGLSAYRAVNTLHFGYKNQSLNVL
jgi:hypothetical protein